MIQQQTLTDSFTEFMRESEPRLRHALCAAFGADLGRDSTAQALAYGWEHWSRVRVMTNPGGYLWQVGRNHALRQHRLAPLYLEPGIDATPWIEPGLPSALERLSERQRTAVILVYGLEWTFGEVAELLGVSKGTVQTQAARGMAKLRDLVGGTDD